MLTFALSHLHLLSLDPFISADSVACVVCIRRHFAGDLRRVGGHGPLPRMLTNGRMLYQGGFSLAIPGGSVVTALSKLEASDMDFSKMHIFFCNERIGIYTYLNLHHSSTYLDLFFNCFP